MEAAAIIDECDVKAVSDTVMGVPSYYAQDVEGGQYETWTVYGCGESVKLVLLFSALPGGSVNVAVESQMAVFD